MILRGLLCLFAVVAVVLAYAATKTDTVRVERSAEIAASPDKVFALLSDFHRWPEWAPQDKEDASMVRTYSGAASGVGAVSAWQGKGSTGHGSMVITEATPEHNVTVTTDFVAPMKAHNVNTFVLEPTARGTCVTWTMVGTNVYMMKVMGVFTNMDHMMGKHFEEGLGNLKVAAER